MDRKIKAVYFNEKKESDLLNYVETLDNFSEWVKNRLRREIDGGNHNIYPDLENLVDRILEAKLKVLDSTIAPPKKEPKEDIKNAVNKMF